MPVSVEGNHSNTGTQEGNLDPTGGNEGKYSGLEMPRFNRCNRDEYFQTNRDRPPALNPSGISPVDSYRGIIVRYAVVYEQENQIKHGKIGAGTRGHMKG